MGRINVLDKNIAELIAAGEVVERPASVIKELVENSIDAGATTVTVEIKNGGITYMRITDNGCGIAREDVPKAFLRHATSKVSTKDDLDKIGTLGFRGEALASVCAVAKVELLTRAKEEQLGTRYEIYGGEEQNLEDVGCPIGTTIIVRNIFYNIPARMKFLKKDVSEANAVSGIMDRIALSHPEIAISFIRDGKQTLNTTGDGKLLSAIYSVYGREFAKGLIPVDYNLCGVTVKGYICKPCNARPNRNMQHFYINGRYVKSLTAMKAIEQAAKGTIMVGKFMSCVLHIGISCSTVDVNVHPAKIEVRFVNERPVFDAVYHAVKSALLKGDKINTVSLNPADMLKVEKPNPFLMKAEPTNSSVPPLAEESKKLSTAQVPDMPPINYIDNNADDLIINKQQAFNKSTEIKNNNYSEPNISVPHTADFGSVMVSDFFDPFKFYKRVDKSTSNESNENINQNELPMQGVDITSTQPIQKEIVNDKAETENNMPVNSIQQIVEEEMPLRFVGEAFNTYIIVEKSKDELMFIDKHAAHERIIYEKLKKEKGKGFAQYLLEPVTVTLSKKEYDSVINNLELLSETGFEIEDFGVGTVLVRSAPQFLDGAEVDEAVCEMAGYLSENKSDIYTEHMDWIYHNVSCRAAIKGGNISKPQELMEIVNILQKDKSIMYCPHGRPISVIVKKREIEKLFGRV